MAADNGTLILDEIGDISPSIQVKLLKFLQDKEVKPVGSSSKRIIDLALINLVEGNLDKASPLPKGHALYKDAKKETLDIFAKNYLTHLFEHTRGNIAKTSRISGLERASIQKIINRLNIDISQFRR